MNKSLGDKKNPNSKTNGFNAQAPAQEISDSEADDVDDDLPNELSLVEKRKSQGLRSHQLFDDLWRPNFHEAAIYIEEGLNNDKFENHPRNSQSSRVLQPIQSQATPHEQASPLKKLRPEATVLILDRGKRSDKQKSLKHGRVGTLINSSRANVVGSHTDIFLTVDGDNKEVEPEASVALKSAKRYLKPKHIPMLSGIQYTTIQTYAWAHNKYLYFIDLIASLALLLLAIVEPPSIDGIDVKTLLHAGIEITALTVVGLELMLKFRWMGPERFFRHGRTIVKLFVLLTMIIEAIVIVARQSIHSRYSRCLRPIFLFDNHYCHGIRRTIRQIFQSMAPIFDMFTLVLFFMFAFTIIARYVLASTNSEYFGTMSTTWGNLLLMTTTANVPDIMLPSFEASRWTSIYFVIFIVINLFLLTNLTMATVYESFTRCEKNKLHKLLLHRRKACQRAFKLLVSRRRPNRIKFKQFRGLMRYLNRNCCPMDAFLVFKALDTDSSGYLTLEEFYQIYDFINLSWRQTYPNSYWYDKCTTMPEVGRAFIANLRFVIEHRYFDATCYAILCLSGILQFIDASSVQPQAHEFKFTSMFIGLFSAEVILRVVALGISDYWRLQWNRFDLVILSLCLIGQFDLPYAHHLSWLYVLRVFKLIKLFEYKRRYWDVWQTLAYIMMKRFVSMACVVLMLNYFFAIIGMELFSEYDLRNCCVNTSLEAQFKFIPDPNNPNIGTNTTPGSPRYYINDFGDVIASYMTLFCMISSTYWLTTMNAYAIVTGTNWSRLYFVVYYISSLVVMNIFIAFILESFLFRIYYRKKLGDGCDEANLFTVEVPLSEQEEVFVKRHLQIPTPKLLPSSNRSPFIARRQGYGLLEDIKSDQVILEISPNNGDVSERPTAILETSPLIESAPDSAHGGERLASSAFVASFSSQATSSSSSSSLAGNSSNYASSANPVRSYPNVGHLIRQSAILRKTNNLRGCSQIYQAEQTRNKFSFTMKMYADEVKEWLAEAEQAERDERAKQRLLDEVADIHTNFRPRRTYSCSY